MALSWRRSSPQHVSGLVRATAVVFASSVSAMSIGFVKNVLAAYYFGTSGAMDAYLLALLLPDAAAQLARTGAFNFIPLFSAEHRRSEGAAWAVASRMLTYWLVVLVATLGLAFVVSGPALALIAPGLAAGPRELALSYTRVLFLMALPMGVARILAVALHAQRRFVAAGASEVAFQLSSTAFLVAFHEAGGAALVWAQVFGGFVQLLVAALGLLRERHNLRPILDPGATSVRRMVRLTLPIYLGDSGDKINLIVTRAFASLLPAGAVSGLQYAYTLVEGLQGMLTGSLVTALFPYLSVRFAQADARGARVGLHRAVVFAALVSVPLAAGLWLAAEPIVVVLFERGSFDERSTHLTASALRLFAPALVALALNGILGSAFHARQDTITPMRAGLLRVGCNIALCAALAPSLGHRGIALAATTSLYLKLLVLLRSMDRLHAPHELKATARALARLLPAVALMVAVVYPASLLARLPRVLEEHVLGALFGLAVLALSSYSLGLWLFCRRELTLHVAVAHRALLHPRPVERGRLAPSASEKELEELGG
jgi:putative peptidoglycan lipid II flippase